MAKIPMNWCGLGVYSAVIGIGSLIGPSLVLGAVIAIRGVADYSALFLLLALIPLSWIAIALTAILRPRRGKHGDPAERQRRIRPVAEARRPLFTPVSPRNPSLPSSRSDSLFSIRYLPSAASAAAPPA